MELLHHWLAVIRICDDQDLVLVWPLLLRINCRRAFAAIFGSVCTADFSGWAWLGLWLLGLCECENLTRLSLIERKNDAYYYQKHEVASFNQHLFGQFRVLSTFPIILFFVTSFKEKELQWIPAHSLRPLIPLSIILDERLRCLFALFFIYFYFANLHFLSLKFF